MARKKPRRVQPGEFPNVLTAFFDGCCEPRNPGGTAGYGVVIMKGRDRVHEFSGYIPASPTTSNNVAEYLAFNHILDWIVENGHQRDSVLVYGDSKLVIEQCFGTWKIRGGFYADYARAAKKKLQSLTKKKLQSLKCVSGFWIPREENSIADELSKAELRTLGVEFRIQPE